MIRLILNLEFIHFNSIPLVKRNLMTELYYQDLYSLKINYNKMIFFNYQIYYKNHKLMLKQRMNIKKLNKSLTY